MIKSLSLKAYEVITQCIGEDDISPENKHLKLIRNKIWDRNYKYGPYKDVVKPLNNVIYVDFKLKKRKAA